MTTLLLIPGLVSDTMVWSPLAQAATQHMPVKNADVTRDRSITDMARRLLAEVKGDLIAVGHSMGGRVALEMAHLAPERVRGLVLANTGHHPKRDGEDDKRRLMVELANSDIGEFAMQWLPMMLDPSRVDDLTLVSKLKEMVKRVGAQVHQRQIHALLTRPDAGAYMAEIECPVLLVAARQDAWSPIAQHQEIADAVADTELVIIEHAGHFAPVERPDDVTAAIEDWLGRRFGGPNA